MRMRAMIAVAAVAASATLPMAAHGGAAIESPSNGTAVYWYWGDNNGEGASYTHKADINSAESFMFRAGVANINSNGTVKVGGGKATNATYGNWVGANGYVATLNINGGTFWSYVVGGGPYGLLRVGVNGGANDSTVNLNSGVLKVEGALYIGGTKYNSHEAFAKNGVVNIYGGTATIPTVNLGTETAGAYANATLNLEGGTLEVSKFYLREYHNQTFNWGSGTIKATADNVFSTATPLGGCTRTAQVTGTPAVFDLNGHTSGISPALTNGTGTLKLTGGGTASLYRTPEYSFYLDKNMTLQLQSDISNTLAVENTFTFSGVANVTGGLVLSAGAKIICDLAAADGAFCSLEATLGFTLPSGVGSVLDVLELVLPEGRTAEDFIVSLSADGKTISVAPNITPFTAVWNVQGVADSPACWTCYDRDGVTVIDNAIPAGSTTNVTLAADADWTSPGALDFARGAVIDLAGHSLAVSDISSLSIFSRTTVTNSSATLSTLTIQVSGSANVVNTDVAILGNIALVKSGTGNLTASKSSQTYSGGTTILEGVLSVGRPASEFPLGESGSTVVVSNSLSSTGIYDVKERWLNIYPVVLRGGNLRSSGGRLGNVTLETDATFDAVASGGFARPGVLDLNGHTLTVKTYTGVAFFVDFTSATAGTIYLPNGAGWLETGDNDVDARSVTFRVACFLGPTHTLDVGNYEALCTGAYNGYSGAMNVHGVFTPTEKFRGCVMQNGSTIDLSGKNDVWNVQSAFVRDTSSWPSQGPNVVTFADGAMVGVRLGNRKITGRAGLKVIDWTDNTPSNLSGLRFVCADDGRNYRLSKKSDGLYAYRSGFVIIVK